MKKLIGFSLLLAVGVLCVRDAEAVGVRGPKGMAIATQTTNVVAVSTAGPAAVYSLVIGTGAVTDFVVLFDSNAATGLTSLLQTSASGYRGRFYASSTTQNTQMSFDPPLQFNNGVMAINATALMTTVITFEKGRPAGQGY